MTNLHVLESSRDSTTPRNTTNSPVKNFDSSPNVAALLLTNVSAIASNELNHSVLIKPQLFDPSVMTLPCRIVPGEMTCACLHYDYGRTTPPPSMVPSDDDENSFSTSPVPRMEKSCSGGTSFCRPIKTSAVGTRNKPSPRRQKVHPVDEYIIQKPLVVREVLSKKFSWKNYPELEDFLIAHRDEYLRHSRLNYSVEQKEYNNTLTENLLELATLHGYVFDNLTFVMLRDKIRCYYKSYLQTLRKKQQRR